MTKPKPKSQILKLAVKQIDEVVVEFDASMLLAALVAQLHTLRPDIEPGHDEATVTVAIDGKGRPKNGVLTLSYERRKPPGQPLTSPFPQIAGGEQSHEGASQNGHTGPDVGGPTDQTPDLAGGERSEGHGPEGL